MKHRIAVISLLAAVVLLAAPGAAHAKGARGATISGPGLDQPIDLDMEVRGQSSTLWKLAEGTRLLETVFLDPARSSFLTPAPPAGDLGPSYVVEHEFYGPEGDRDLVIRQHLYPYATGGPVVSTPAGQTLYGSPAGSGWFRADDTLLARLVAVGLPATAPVETVPASAPRESSTNAAFGGTRLTLAALGVAVLVAAVIGVARRRRARATTTG